MIHKPHPPAIAEWPDYVKEIYRKGCERIDKLREQLGVDGEVPIPFTCYLCDQKKTNYSFKNGDGLPVCRDCCEVPVEFRTGVEA
jgi:hypothetical protein